MPPPFGAPPMAGDVDETDLAQPSACQQTAPATAAVTLDDDFFSSLCATPAPAAASQDRLKSVSCLAGTRGGTRAVAPRPRPRTAAASGAVAPRSPSAPAAFAATGIRKMSSDCAKAVRMGQAILDAAAVVKELVENSLDAGATRVDVQVLGKAGCERITVTDNGSGIGPASHLSLCRPHSTSKLTHFSDLDGISTFGFRGEAMSAIAELCEKVTVTTRTSDDQVGTCLVYGSNGDILKQTRAPRRAGTTIQVEQLFARLPVRLQDAGKHSSRDIARCLAVMQSYAMIATRVRFELRVGTDVRLLTQPQPAAKPMDALRAAISSVLGRKQAEVMMPCGDIDWTMVTSGDGNTNHRSRDVSGEDADATEGGAEFEGYSVSGYVSKSNHAGCGGGGRLSGSWQFFYLNGRPVDMPRVARAVNESYRRFALSSHASPTFVLSFSVPNGMFDVNLSPDKRQVMIHKEPVLIDALQCHLEALWSPKEARAIPTATKLASDFLSPVAPSCSAAKLNTSIGIARNSGPSGSAKVLVDETTNENKRCHVELLVSSRKRPKSSTLLDFVNQRSVSARTHNAPRTQLVGGVSSISNDGPLLSSLSPSCSLAPTEAASGVIDSRSVLPSEARCKSLAAREEMCKAGSSESQMLRQERTVPVVSDSAKADTSFRSVEPVSLLSFSLADIVAERSRRRQQQQDSIHLSQGFDVSQRSPLYACSVAVRQPALGCSQGSLSEESDAEREAAEAELSRVFKQSWFGDLKVLGQFNKGFIVCILHEKDIFIVDQHASDEKFNFEDLENNTAIETQRLIRPMSLDLAADEELLVIDNLDLFKRSGFDIEHRPSRPPTQRLYLLSQPSSKRTMFVVDDLREMLSTLHESTRSRAMETRFVLRPKRVRAMFASRACRKSVMIGTTLSKQKMELLVRQLKNLLHPWSCPHGRPTMRHLVDIKRTQHLRKLEC